MLKHPVYTDVKRVLPHKHALHAPDCGGNKAMDEQELIDAGYIDAEELHSADQVLIKILRRFYAFNE